MSNVASFDKRDLQLAMVAGETSGDYLGALLLEGLKKQNLHFNAAGIAGNRMQKEGVTAWWPSHLLAVRGYVEVLRHYVSIVCIRNQLQKKILADRPDLFIGIDAPDFNLSLEKKLKKRGVPTLHMVCPAIWAWRPHRIELMKQACDHVLCLFPFEPALLHKEGIEATYIGHPLTHVIESLADQKDLRASFQLSLDDQVVAVLPGSRLSEIQHLLPTFLDTVSLLKKRHPHLKFVMPVAPGLMSEVQAMVLQHAAHADIRCWQGQSHGLMKAADAVLVASGTATLEVALCQRPMVVAYRMPPLSWFLIQRQQLLPWVSLPNILAQKAYVPEYIQEACTPKALADALDQQLHLNSDEKMRLQVTYRDLMQSLHQNTALLAAQAVAQVSQHA